MRFEPRDLAWEAQVQDFKIMQTFSLFRDDIIRAIKKLHVLGAGFELIPLQGRQLVQSVPGELNIDHTMLLQSAQVESLSMHIYHIAYQDIAITNNF